MISCWKLPATATKIPPNLTHPWSDDPPLPSVVPSHHPPPSCPSNLGCRTNNLRLYIPNWMIWIMCYIIWRGNIQGLKLFYGLISHSIVTPSLKAGTHKSYEKIIVGSIIKIHLTKTPLMLHFSDSNQINHHVKYTNVFFHFLDKSVG
jgi:hypothetical protein